MPNWRDAPIVEEKKASPAWASAPEVDPYEAFSKATGMSATPWHSQGVFGGSGPSVRDMLSAAPVIGGAIGGIAASPGIATTAGGAALGGAAGAALKQHGERLLGITTPQTSNPMAALNDIAVEGAIQGGVEGVGRGVGRGLGAALRGTGRRIMQSAIKPSEKLLQQYRTSAPKLAEQFMAQGLNVTRGGLGKLEGLLQAKNSEIAAAISETKLRIPKSLIVKRLDDLVGRYGDQVNPTADLEAISEVGKNFLKHPRYRGPSVSVQEAQKLKVGTYQRLSGKYGRSSEASVDAEKAVARGLKEEIAARVPSVSNLNAEESVLLSARDAVRHALARAERSDPVGFAWVASNPKTFIAALIERSPAIKSMIANGMWKSAGLATKVPPQLIRFAVASLVSQEDDESPSGTDENRPRPANQ